MPKRILLADDSITIQKVVELTFSDGDYEVTAVNNGTKAIQKLSEMRPDIILSDIIMPEKNGYEVCEYVKSHPEFRGIPVILLTGTFEPFDPDRADKAGCDAVVTKPFESQGLIHKVEELIENARKNAPPAAAAASPAPAMPADSPFAAPADNFSTSAFQAQGADIFGAAPTPAAAPPGETPFDFGGAAGTGETKAFPKLSFDELQKLASESMSPAPAPPAAAPPPPPPPAPPAVEASPWDEPAPPPAAPAPAPPPAPAAMSEASPWDEAPAATGGETKAFPRMSFDDLSQMAKTPAPAPAPPPPAAAPEPSPWESPAQSALSHDTMTPFESPATPAPATETSSLWDEAPATGGETKAFPRMSFEELSSAASMPAPASHTPAPPSAPSEPAAEEVPFAASAAPTSYSPPSSVPTLEEPVRREPAPASAPASSTSSGAGGDLTEEQIDRIARRVVQLMSEQVVKNIAWEVIPDLAEMVVKERIRQLESEA